MKQSTTAKTVDPNIIAMTQAILLMVNNQNQSNSRINSMENSIESLSEAVNLLTNTAVTVTDMDRTIDNYMQVKPEHIALASTMGYTTDENAKLIYMKEIKARLARLYTLNGMTFIGKFEQDLFKAIGKNRNEIKLEAQALSVKRGKVMTTCTIWDAVESIPDYLKWASIILVDIERKNHVFNRMYTHFDLLSNKNSEFRSWDIEKMDCVHFKIWLERRIKDFEKMCNTDKKSAMWLLYNAFKWDMENKQPYKPSSFSKQLLQNFSGDMKTDIAYITKHPNSELRSHFVYIATKCLVI